MKRKVLLAALSLLGMLMLVLDTKTAISGAVEGVELCIQTLIPSIFPFFMLSTLLTSAVGQLPGFHVRFGIFLTGLLGGYPMGAKSIAESCANGRLDQQEANRMMAFCNNAGPAFLFGIGMGLFDDLWLCLLLWLIHIASAAVVAILTPLKGKKTSNLPLAKPISITASLQSSLRAMAQVCGWVIFFRVWLSILRRWFLWLLPEMGLSILYGLLELSNGALTLHTLQPVGLQWLLFSAYLGFGGLCVALQTGSVVFGSGVDLRYYLPGKITQTAVSILLCTMCQILLPAQQRFFPNVVIIVLSVSICVAYGLFWKIVKIPVAFDKKLMYN